MRRDTPCRTWLTGSLLASVGLLLCGCSQTDTSAPGTPAGKTATASVALTPFQSLEGRLDIAGGTAHVQVMEEAAKRIMTAHPNIQITVAGGGSGVGVQKVGEGLVQIGNTGRALSEQEIQKHGLKSFAFAIDGVAVVVHPSSTVKNLSTQQIRDLFAGKITDWKDVGGKEGKVTLYTRDEASGTREVFWEKLLGKGEVAGNASVVVSNGAMKTAVAGDTQGMGYVSIGHVDQSVASVMVDGVEPSQSNAMSGAYKVTRNLYMNTKGEPAGLTQAFIDYIMGAEGAQIVRSKGYIPLAK